MVFTHFQEDLNIDHQLVTKAALTAFRPQFGLRMEIYSYYIPSATDYASGRPFNGNSYMILKRQDVEKKLQVLKCYEEEMRTYPHSRSYENVENLMKVWGAEVGAQYCEKFELLRMVG
jgi:LmbE family N-acetylglucosaminyl deacetylase